MRLAKVVVSCRADADPIGRDSASSFEEFFEFLAVVVIQITRSQLQDSAFSFWRILFFFWKVPSIGRPCSGHVDRDPGVTGLTPEERGRMVGQI